MRGAGRVVFAATLLLIVGTLNIIYGIGALDDANIFVNDKRYILTNLNTLGWVLIILGVIQLTGGFSLMAGNSYGRVIGIIGGSLGAIGALLSIGGTYPWWSLGIFALSVYVVHGISSTGTRTGRRRPDQRRPMTTKADFTDEEWTRLGRAPIVAGMAISLADPGGPIEAFKEVHASLKAVLDAAEQGDRGEFVQSIAKDVAAGVRARKNPAAGFKPRGALAGQEILDELSAVNEIVTRKAAPEEAEAFRAWLLDAAQRTAEAAKEGGFMGFKAEQVSEGEQRMLDKLAEVLGG